MNFNKIIEDFKRGLIPYSDKMIEDTFTIIRESGMLEEWNKKEGKTNGEVWDESDILTELYWKDLENTTEATGFTYNTDDLISLVNNEIIRELKRDYKEITDLLDDDLRSKDEDDFSLWLEKIKYKSGDNVYLDYVLYINGFSQFEVKDYLKFLK